MFQLTSTEQWALENIRPDGATVLCGLPSATTVLVASALEYCRQNPKSIAYIFSPIWHQARYEIRSAIEDQTDLSTGSDTYGPYVFRNGSRLYNAVCYGHNKFSNEIISVEIQFLGVCGLEAVLSSLPLLLGRLRHAERKALPMVATINRNFSGAIERYGVVGHCLHEVSKLQLKTDLIDLSKHAILCA